MLPPLHEINEGKKKVVTNLFVGLFFTPPETMARIEPNHLSPPLCGVQLMTPALPQHMGQSQKRADEHGREMGAQVPFSVEILRYISPWCPDISSSIATVSRGPSWVSVSSVFRIIRSFLVYLPAPPQIHTPLSRGLVGIKLGMHSRVTSAPEDRSLKFQGLLDPKQGRNPRRQRSRGYSKEVCQVQ